MGLKRSGALVRDVRKILPHHFETPTSYVIILTLILVILVSGNELI